MEIYIMTRRIVTGNDTNGKSFAALDGESPGKIDFGFFSSEEIWTDDPSNPDPNLTTDPANQEVHHLSPPHNGSKVRIFTFQPQQVIDSIPKETLRKAELTFKTDSVLEDENPYMHTTPTIDYGIVLSGEITLELDDGEIILKAGDIVVQRATRHAWHNRSSSVCTIAFILIDSPNYRQNDTATSHK